MAKTDSKTASNVVDIAQARAARIRRARPARCIRRDPIRKAAPAAL
ncbi:hypothetical protein [Hydrogenophaga sp. ANAO-22]|jgi:hypothetical protein